ncbi:mitochondrial carrier domain-containing protein [Haematococcus lacustris]
MSREHADLVAGAVAGAANVLSGYPLDTVKVRMQSSSPGAPYGAMACLRHILRHEGVPGLFRGVTTPLVGGALESGVNYMVYCQVLQALAPSTSSGSGQRGVSSAQHGDNGSSSSNGSSPQGPSWASPLPGAPQPSPLPPQLVHVGLAGAAAGAALSLLLSPVELLKCRMQSAEYRQLGGPGAVLRDLLAAEGPRGLGRGLGATVMREVPGNALFFVVYEGLKRALHQPALTTPGSSGTSPERGPGPVSSPGQQQQHSLWGSAVREAGAAVLCGGCAGSVMWAVVLPLDVAKTRLQVAVPGSAWDVGVVQHLGMLWREGGCGALWRGLGPTLVRAFPANAAQWLAWEWASRQLR